MSKVIWVLEMFFGIALAAACSSSSSPTGGNTSSGSGAGSSTSGGSGSGSGSSLSSGAGGAQSGTSTAMQTSGSGGGACGPTVGVACPTGQHCCTNTSTQATMCGATCSPPTIIVDCTAPSDCKDPAAPKCCGLHLLAAAGAQGSSDAGATEGGASVPTNAGVQCVATCPMSDSFLFCATNADCFTGQTCNTVQGPVKQCGAATDGG